MLYLPVFWSQVEYKIVLFYYLIKCFQCILIQKDEDLLTFNPITYGILTFRQLRGGEGGGGLFGSDPEIKVKVNGLI